MELIRRFIFTLLGSTFILAWTLCLADQTPFYYNYNSGWQWQLNTDIGSMVKTDTVQDSENSFQKLLSLFRLSSQDWYDSGTSKAIYYIKMIVNMLLSLTAFISLIMIIYAFYMIFFTKEDSGVTKAKQVLKWVAIALIVMWLSRFIVSFLFWFEQWATTQSNITLNNQIHSITSDIIYS